MWSALSHGDGINKDSEQDVREQPPTLSCLDSGSGEAVPPLFTFANKMKTPLPALFLIFVICACSKKPPSRSAALPDNVMSDKPIVLKEGQAVILMMEGDRDLMVGASVSDGKLSVAEIDQKKRNFGVTWRDADTWDTSTTVKDGSNTTVVFDKNGDGYADFKAEITPTGTRRYELQGEDWVEVKSKKSQSEQDGSGNGG